MNDHIRTTKLSKRCSGEVVYLVMTQKAFLDVWPIDKFMHCHVEADLGENVIGGGDTRPC
jgi:hypothetical protein